MKFHEALKEMHDNPGKRFRRGMLGGYYNNANTYYVEAGALICEYSGNSVEDVNKHAKYDWQPEPPKFPPNPRRFRALRRGTPVTGAKLPCGYWIWTDGSVPDAATSQQSLDRQLSQLEWIDE